MLHHQKGNIIFECDDCGVELDTETSNFVAALNVLRRENWHSEKLDETWAHFCDECK